MDSDDARDKLAGEGFCVCPIPWISENIFSADISFQTACNKALTRHKVAQCAKFKFHFYFRSSESDGVMAVEFWPAHVLVFPWKGARTLEAERFAYSFLNNLFLSLFGDVSWMEALCRCQLFLFNNLISFFGIKF